ncbi:MAG: M1 family metallopeptidase [Chloroflexota bacterium]|nr:M1 family metallopeptidase [Chloroflexota bacterium]
MRMKIMMGGWLLAIGYWTRGWSRAAVPLVLGAMMLGGVAAHPAWVGARETTSVPGAHDLFADVVPGALAPAERAADTLSAYRMDVAFDPALGTIGGEMTLTWRNPATVALDEVWFRLFPNAFYYGAGNLDVVDLTVDGAPVTPEFSLGDTALRVLLPDAVAPGASAEIALAFTTTVPADATGSYGIFSRDTRNGSWVLADWYPILAVYEEGDGWALPEVTSFGDPTYAPSAFYDVRVTSPDDLTVVATGVVTAEDEDEGTVTQQFIAGPARDFVIVADDDHAALRREVAGTLVTLWTAPNLDPAVSEQTLAVAVDALTYYNDHFGPYPAREIDLVQTDPSGALGIAWAGLLFLDGPALLGTYGEYNPEGLATVVAHELAHLWWGILVGGDSNKHGYIQEGLATVSSILYLNDTLGAEVVGAELDAWVTGPALDLLQAGDAIVDVPIAEGDDEALRSAATYGKGSLGFLAIRQEIGAAAFTAALRDIATRYAWGEMTPEQLREAFERASDRDLDDLWRHWFDEAVMTRDEIEKIAGAFAG